MPAFVKSEKDWKRARKAADKAGVKGEDHEQVHHVYIQEDATRRFY